MIKAATELEEETEIDERKGQMNQRDRDGTNADTYDKKRSWGKLAGQSSQGSQPEGGGSSTTW
eukprot:7568934-Heterocapsa_arctica.AAC.1